MSMNISEARNLDAFRQVAGTADSIGYVDMKHVSGKASTLVKLAANRHFSNPAVKEHDDNFRWVRADLYDALKASLAQKGGTVSAQTRDAFLAAVGGLLGREAKDGGVKFADTPFSRRELRAILFAHDMIVHAQDAHGAAVKLKVGPQSTVNEVLDAYGTLEILSKAVRKNASARVMMRKIEDAFVRNPAKYGGVPLLRRILGNYSVGPFEHGDNAERVRKLSVGIIRGVLGKESLSERDVASVNAKGLSSLAWAVVDGRIRDANVLAAELKGYADSDLINAEEVRNIAEKWNKAKEDEKGLVRIEGEVKRSEPMSEEQINAELKKDAGREDKNSTGFFGKLASFFVPVKVSREDVKADHVQEVPQVAPPNLDDFTCVAADIQNFLADLVFDGDTLETDLTLDRSRRDQTGKAGANQLDKTTNRCDQLRAVMLRHLKELTALFCDRTLLDTLPPDVRTVAGGLLDNMFPAKDLFGCDADKLTRQDSPRVYAKLKDQVQKLGTLSLGFMVGAIDKAVKDGVGEIQKTIMDNFATMFGGHDLAGLIERVLGDSPLDGSQPVPGRKYYRSVDDMLEEISRKGADLGISIRLDPAGPTCNETWVVQYNGQTIELEKGTIKDASREAGGIQKTAAKYQADCDAVTARRNAQKKNGIKVQRMLLSFLASGVTADPNHGYGAFMIKAASTYFESMSELDKRAMFAAGIRYMPPERKVPDDIPENQRAEAQTRVDEENNSAKLGALLKGTGPLMQKMLQGMASMDVPQSFKAALEDMRSNLAPIAPHIVKAHLLELIRQNPEVESITVKKSLGAASVGQAFLCEVTMRNGEKRDVVVKMLRPDAELRCQREKEIFLMAAREVDKEEARLNNAPLAEGEKGAMEVTYLGQLSSIEDELDLRIEAENTRSGRVYDLPTQDVSSMKLDPAFKPAKHVFVVKKAEGTTVDRLLKQFSQELDEIAAELQTRPQDENVKPKLTDGVADLGQKVRRVVQIQEQLIVQQTRLIELAKAWCDEAIYVGGYYHGDLHAGNIMVDDVNLKKDTEGFLARTQKNGAPGPVDLAGNKGLTVIDFGNATQLTPDQRVNVLRMIAATAAKDTNRFMTGYRTLMTPAGQQKFATMETKIHDMIHNVLHLGTMGDSGERIQLVLGKLQQMGFELPAPIFRFMQCQIRLQGTINETNALIARTRNFVPKLFGPVGHFLVTKDTELPILKAMSEYTHSFTQPNMDAWLKAIANERKKVSGSGELYQKERQRIIKALVLNPMKSDKDGQQSYQQVLSELNKLLTTFGFSGGWEPPESFELACRELHVQWQERDQKQKELVSVNDKLNEPTKAQNKLAALKAKRGLVERFAELAKLCKNYEGGFGIKGLSRLLVDAWDSLETTLSDNLDGLENPDEVKKHFIDAVRIRLNDLLPGTSEVERNAVVDPLITYIEDAIRDQLQLKKDVRRQEKNKAVLDNGEVKVDDKLWYTWFYETIGTPFDVFNDSFDKNAAVATVDEEISVQEEKVRSLWNEGLDELQERKTKIEDEIKEHDARIKTLETNIPRALRLPLNVVFKTQGELLDKLASDIKTAQKHSDNRNLDDFSDALGEVIGKHKKDSLWKLGLGTVIEYGLTGKLNETVSS